MQLSELITKLQQTLEKDGDASCFFWVASEDPNKILADKDDSTFVQHLTENIVYREPVLFSQDVEITDENDEKQKHKLIII